MYKFCNFVKLCLCIFKDVKYDFNHFTRSNKQRLETEMMSNTDRRLKCVLNRGRIGISGLNSRLTLKESKGSFTQFALLLYRLWLILKICYFFSGTYSSDVYIGRSVGISTSSLLEQSRVVPRHTQEAGHSRSIIHVPAFLVRWCSEPVK